MEHIAAALLFRKALPYYNIYLIYILDVNPVAY